jgi:hypothetical protein
MNSPKVQSILSATGVQLAGEPDQLPNSVRMKSIITLLLALDPCDISRTWVKPAGLQGRNRREILNLYLRA